MQGLSQKYYSKRELISIKEISIAYISPRLYINVKTTKPLHFQLWNNEKLVLHGVGRAKGEESFPVIRGEFKFILYDEKGKSKIKIFQI